MEPYVIKKRKVACIRQHMTRGVTVSDAMFTKINNAVSMISKIAWLGSHAFTHFLLHSVVNDNFQLPTTKSNLQNLIRTVFTESAQNHKNNATRRNNTYASWATKWKTEIMPLLPDELRNLNISGLKNILSFEVSDYTTSFILHLKKAHHFYAKKISAERKITFKAAQRIKDWHLRQSAKYFGEDNIDVKITSNPEEPELEQIKTHHQALKFLYSSQKILSQPSKFFTCFVRLLCTNPRLRVRGRCAREELRVGPVSIDETPFYSSGQGRIEVPGGKGHSIGQEHKFNRQRFHPGNRSSAGVDPREIATGSYYPASFSRVLVFAHVCCLYPCQTDGIQVIARWESPEQHITIMVTAEKKAELVDAKREKDTLTALYNEQRERGVRPGETKVDHRKARPPKPSYIDAIPPAITKSPKDFSEGIFAVSSLDPTNPPPDGSQRPSLGPLPPVVVAIDPGHRSIWTASRLIDGALDNEKQWVSHRIW